MVRVFCDFDGTVCQEDAGARFFRTYAREKADGFIEELLPGKLFIQDWLMQMCESFPPLGRQEFNDFFRQFSIDPYFGEFLYFAEENKMDVTILSDGLDAYIEQILSNSGLSRVRFYANHADFTGPAGEERLSISFPYTDADCRMCGNCKRNLMLNISADEDIIVYAGDGYSDRCPAQYADFVFAKGELIKHCQKQNITFFEFDNFKTVKSKLQEILKRKRIRHRQEAAAARRRVFLQE